MCTAPAPVGGRLRPFALAAWKASCPHRPELQEVEDVPELPRVRHPERVGIAIEVEARNRGERHPPVELGVRLAGEHLHVVAEGDELARQIADVDTLAAAVRLAPVGERHAQTPR